MTLLELKMAIDEMPIEFLTSEIEIIKIDDESNSTYKFGGFIEGRDEYDNLDEKLLFLFEEIK
jgi:hypothetical protein